MITVIVTVALFIVFFALLTALVMAGEYKLVNRGDVKLVINSNEQGAISVSGGKTLLDTLKANGIYLPSACGGRGTCGVCRCRITEGGGALLPTETTHITRKLAKEGERLACQVKVKGDMRITVPEEILSATVMECTVVSNDFKATYIKELCVKIPAGVDFEFKPGGYVQVIVPPFDIDYRRDIQVPDTYSDEWERFGLFDLKLKNGDSVERAYSMANYPAEKGAIKLNVRIATPPWDQNNNKFKNVPAGLASTYIFSLKPGDRVKVSGPFGEFFIKDTKREMVYIGGGAGMAPLRSHIFHLFNTLKTGRRVSYWYGARSRREIFYEREFRAIEKKFKNFKFNIALSEPLPVDRWNGPVGFIHEVVRDHYLAKHPEPEEIEYYLCGPTVMTDAVERMLESIGVEPAMIMFDRFG